ncbi:MAG: DUF4062 domain-containing protein, partial [Rhodoglobus sp.]
PSILLESACPRSRVKPQVIDECNYYMVIVGGRYGSISAEGVSYTEMEYDYAVPSDIPVLGFVHGSPDDIPAGESELGKEAREKLDAFRAKVITRMVKRNTSRQSSVRTPCTNRE